MDATPKTEEWAAFLTRITETKDLENLPRRLLLGYRPRTRPRCRRPSRGQLRRGQVLEHQGGRLARGLGELDPEKRKALYLDMQNIIADEVPNVILDFPQATVLTNKRVKSAAGSERGQYPLGLSLRSGWRTVSSFTEVGWGRLSPARPTLLSRRRWVRVGQRLGSHGGTTMARYLIRRVLGAIPLLFGISFLVFMLVNATPGESFRRTDPESGHTPPGCAGAEGSLRAGQATAGALLLLARQSGPG